MPSQSKYNLSAINRPNSYSTCEKCNISTNQHYNVLYDSYRISVIVAGSTTEAMIDTGSSIRAISSEMLKKINNTTYSDVHIVNKICTLADGSDIKLQKIVVLPVKLSNVAYNVRLYILPVKHLNMIIGCDLLTRLAATIDYKHNVLLIENCGEHDTVPYTSENMLGQLYERKSKSIDLLSTGNHWLKRGFSCNMVLKKKKKLIMYQKRHCV